MFRTINVIEMSCLKENAGIILAIILVIFPLGYICAFPGTSPPDFVLTWGNMALQFIFGTAVTYLTLKSYGLNPTEIFKSKKSTD